jgi:Zn-dependent alcohol dehydrogenase
MILDLYMAGKLKLDELATHRFSLEQINEAVHSLESGEAVRPIIIY